MSFRMICSKCGTRNYSITRDIRTSSAKDPVSGLIYACRCGKQMFGAQVTEEYDRQLREHEANGGTRVREVAEAAPVVEDSEKLRKANEYRREYLARKRQEEQSAAAARKQEEDRKWRERVARTDSDTSSPQPEGDFEVCAWKDCGKARRPRSKYCSRECSNKNARHRHKQRKREDEAA